MHACLIIYKMNRPWIYLFIFCILLCFFCKFAYGKQINKYIYTYISISLHICIKWQSFFTFGRTSLHLVLYTSTKSDPQCPQSHNLSSAISTVNSLNCLDWIGRLFSILYTAIMVYMCVCTMYTILFLNQWSVFVVNGGVVWSLWTNGTLDHTRFEQNE